MHKYFKSNVHLFKKLSPVYNPSDVLPSAEAGGIHHVIVGVQTQAPSTLILAKLPNLLVPHFFIYKMGLIARPASLGCFKDIHVHAICVHIYIYAYAYCI